MRITASKTYNSLLIYRYRYKANQLKVKKFSKFTKLFKKI